MYDTSNNFSRKFIEDHLAVHITIHLIRWYTQLDVGTQKARSWHVAHPYYCQSDISTECQLIIFGGNAHVKGDFGDRVDMADLRILTFGMNTYIGW